MPNGGFAVVTGASSGIGKELAKCCAQDGYELVIVADEPAIEQAAEALASHGVAVEAVEADLATVEGVDKLISQIGKREMDLLFLNAGRGLGDGFVEQEWKKDRRVIDTNITGTIYLARRLADRAVPKNRRS
jgi:short-subunit dehydrogenase